MFVRVNAEQTALQMRKDLRHWRHAAELASHCAPQEITSLQLQHAEVLETQGDVAAAHAIFQVCLQLLLLSHSGSKT
jgi:WD repeat-containing protein 19